MIQFPFLAGQVGFALQQAGGSSGALKKLITITGATSAGTNYPVLFKVGESSGAASPDFYFGSTTTTFPSTKNDPGDVQFTDTGGTALPQWVEQVTGTTPNRVAWIWVKVSADLGTNQDIYCTYRNGGTKASDGTTVFTLFDDFDVSTLDTGKWTYGTGSGGLVISGSELQLTGNGTTKFLYTATTYGDGLEVLGRVNPTGSATSYVGRFGFDAAYIFQNDWDSATTSEVVVGPSTKTQLAARYQSSYYRMQIRRKSGVGSLLIDGVSRNTIASGIPTTSQPVWLCNVLENATVGKVDWLAIKKYQITEPVFGSAGSEIAA
jgi:hypothetical protein